MTVTSSERLTHTGSSSSGSLTSSNGSSRWCPSVRACTRPLKASP